jgi:hypothetical protein
MDRDTSTKMKWEIKEASFKYNGNPVVRRTATTQTPLGEFKVYESVGGSIFLVHPFIKRQTNPIADMIGFRFEPDPTGDFYGPPKIRCQTFDGGIEAAEAKWTQIKNIINRV